MKEWDDLTKDQIYAVTLQKTKPILDALVSGQTKSTNDIAEILYPRENAVYAKQDFIRRIIYQAIAWHATRDLKMYCTKGEQIGKYMGKPKRPWIWHSPKVLKICDRCGSEYFE